MWTCDTCSELIERVEDGWVEWITIPGAGMSRNLRLVHHKPASPRQDIKEGCQFNQQEEYQRDGGIVMDMSLDYFLGAGGLMRLLSLIAEKKLPTEEVLEMIKRLHISGYEKARLYFDEAIAAGVFEPNTAKGYYSQSNIQDVLRYIERKR
jgi:hypothetical protein